jgi:hypothetical protein
MYIIIFSNPILGQQNSNDIPFMHRSSRGHGWFAFASYSAADRALDLFNVQLVDTTENEKRQGAIILNILFLRDYNS